MFIKTISKTLIKVVAIIFFAQAAYAEIFVSPLHWPDFDRDAFIESIRDYIHRERRFGKTSEQIVVTN